MNLLGTSLLLAFLFPADDKPTPKLPLSKETTYITEPLDKDGYLDYGAALNDRLGKGITPEKNANVLIWKAVGPKPDGGRGMPAEFFKRLGMEEPPANGDYFIGMSTYIKDHLKLDEAELETIFDQQSRANKRPWRPKEYPHIFAWLKANEKPLALVVEATKRPDYFNPLVSRGTDKRPGSLLGAFLPGVHKSRELATALATRAMLMVGDEKFDDAWQDLLACHRLGRLVERGGTLTDALVGVAIDQITSNADLAYVERAGLTAKQIQGRLKQLQDLAPMASLANKLELGERFMCLDAFQLVRRGGPAMLKALLRVPGTIVPGEKPGDEEFRPWDTIDWEIPLRNANRWYDRLGAAHGCKDRAERERELGIINRDVKILAAETVGSLDLTKLAFGKDPPDKAIGKAVGDILIRQFVPGTQAVQKACDRRDQIQRNVRIAYALAGYHADNGRYPAKLDDLAPKYLAAVPDDLFSGKPVIYRPSEKGYLFYSVGPNGKDEGGRSDRFAEEEDSVGDDIPVRMPLPELKRAK